MQASKKKHNNKYNNQETEQSSLIVKKSNGNLKTTQQNNRKQLSSFILFLSVIIFVNLCPFHPELELLNNNSVDNNESVELHHFKEARTTNNQIIQKTEMNFLESCFKFIKLMFTNPVNFNKRSGANLRRSSIQAEARVIGKMAKMWYIKKKIKKLSKKLKKHTIAVPVFTAIPIYEHSYYPQPHVTHVSHGGIHHAAAASSYSPALAQIATTTSGQTVMGSVPASASQSQQLATSASTNHQQLAHPYRPMGGGPHGYHHHHSMYHPMQAAGHQIINSYAPSPPLFVDEAGGLYGTYNNAYGRYDGGYHLW